VTANNVSTGTLNAAIDNSGGTIGGSANVTFNIGGAFTTTGDASFVVFNSTNVGSGGGTIGSDATINVSAASIFTGGALFAEIFNSAGTPIVGNADINFDLTGDLTTMGDATFLISGGRIGSDAVINVTANNLSTDTLDATIENIGGTMGIVGSANLAFNISGQLATQSDTSFTINNSNGVRMIGMNAGMNVTAASISTLGSLSADIRNFNNGTIVGNATINVTAANIIANSLLAQIDNTNGTINGNAAINMNVSGGATVTNDATVKISGNDPAGSAAININGTYDVGGMFVSQIGAPGGIGGNGTLTFNNASAHADVLKAGVFGTNGVLNVGGGALSADTTLKLYAPGSNGQLNFVSNVTLGGNGEKILAANSVTIFDNIVVTIGGPNPVDVFTNNANYTGFGGNGTTTGTFAGAGANGPEPLNLAPPFDDPSIPTRPRIHPRPPSPVAIGGKVPVGSTVAIGKKIDNVIHVGSSDELLSLLDGAAPGPGGKITIPDSGRGSHGRNASRFNGVADLNAHRHAEQIRTASSFSPRRLPQ
jgi:hypothetical protein